MPNRSILHAPAAPRHQMALRWLAELRWILLGLQLALLVGFGLYGGEAILIGLLVMLATATAASNLWLLRARPPGRSAADRIFAAALGLDVAMLTILLGSTGGPENPFAIFYVLPVSTAALIGGRRLTWLIAGAGVVGYAAQFRWHRSVDFWDTMIGLPGSAGPGSGVHAHLLGMWISVLLVAVAIASLAQRLQAAFARHERVLEQARRRLERSDQLAWLTSFAAGAAHDLGSPLATMAVAAREIECRAQAAGEAEGASEARLIRDEVDRCRQILDRMAAGLDPMLDEEGRRDSIEDLTVLLAADLRSDIERVAVRAEDGVHELPVRAQRLAQLLMPIIRNGLRASGPRGAVEVRLSATSESLRAEIIDRGEGMSPEVLERASEPFYTTRPRGESSGLGLYIVSVVVEAMGGSLSLRSQSGRGTTVSLRIPLLESAPRPAGAVAASATAAAAAVSAASPAQEPSATPVRVPSPAPGTPVAPSAPPQAEVVGP